MGSDWILLSFHILNTLQQGVVELISEVAKDIPITYVGRNRRWRNWNEF